MPKSEKNVLMLCVAILQGKYDKALELFIQFYIHPIYSIENYMPTIEVNTHIMRMHFRWNKKDKMAINVKLTFCYLSKNCYIVVSRDQNESLTGVYICWN